MRSSGSPSSDNYGLLSPARKKVGLVAARAALGVPPPQAAVIESVADFMRRVARIEHERCPHCGSGRFRIVATILPERYRPKPRAHFAERDRQFRVMVTDAEMLHGYGVMLPQTVTLFVKPRSRCCETAVTVA
jgi:hypothetical protein